MPDLSGLPKPLLAMWGDIQQAVYQKATTGQLYGIIRASMAEQGIGAIPGLFQGVNVLRSLAAAQRRASESFMSAAPGAAIDAGMLAQGINSRSLDAQSAFAEYQVRFQHLTVSGGVQSSQWRTLSYRGTIATTVGEVMAEVEATGAYLAQKYNVQHAGIGSVVLLRL